MSNRQKPLQVRVVAKTIEAEGIIGFELAPADGNVLPGFTAGAHIDVYPGKELCRQYSLCWTSTRGDRYRIAVLREAAGRGGSIAMHDTVDVGDVIAIGAPRNNFPLKEDAAHSLLLAGGIGVTPIISMAERLHQLGASFELRYCLRTRSRGAFLQELTTAPFADRVALHFDDGVPQQQMNLKACIAAQPSGTHLYVCGPRGFIDAAIGSARSLGWPDSRLHLEFFGAQPTAQQGSASFEVQIASTGQVVTVSPEQSVVQALASAGIQVEVSCEQGVCGTCITRVLSGEPEHRDVYLTAQEHEANDQFTPCCSRSRSERLVLDL